MTEDRTNHDFYDPKGGPRNVDTATDWKPRYIVSKAPGVDGPPIPDDEPCLVIRAQDRMAPVMLSTYIDRYKMQRGFDITVVSELLDHLARLILWQEDHPDRVKVADR